MQTFLEYYEREIRPRVAALDLFLKTEEPPYPQGRVAALLGLSVGEMAQLMRAQRVACITKGVLFRLLLEGSSPLCGMFRRAIACGTPTCYTPEQIAYIFALDPQAVREAAAQMGQELVPEESLPRLFAHVLICPKPDPL